MTNKIDITKKYRTRSKCDVRLLSCDGAKPYNVIGVMDADGIKINKTWSSEGEEIIGLSGDLDLVEVKPPFSRVVYLNIYGETRGSAAVKAHSSRVYADINAGFGRIACIRAVVEGREGQFDD